METKALKSAATQTIVCCEGSNNRVRPLTNTDLVRINLIKKYIQETVSLTKSHIMGSC